MTHDAAIYAIAVWGAAVAIIGAAAAILGALTDRGPQ